MEKPDTTDTLLDDLPPGGQTRFSAVFGAIGNYAMIGTLGAVAIKQAHKIYLVFFPHHAIYIIGVAVNDTQNFI